MIIYQDLAYCRFIFIWSILFLLDYIHFSPLITLFIIFILENISDKPYMSKHKQTGLLLSELFFIILLLLKSKKLYIKENIMIFWLYLSYLYLFNIDVITLHNYHLKIDDLQHNQENYWQYLYRIWCSFLIH